MSQSTILRLFPCYSERNVNQLISNRVKVRVWVRLRVRVRVTVRVTVKIRVTSEKRSHSKCIGLHFVRLITFVRMSTIWRDTGLGGDISCSLLAFCGSA